MTDLGQEEVIRMILDGLEGSSLQQLVGELKPVLAGGKMLRAGLVLRLAPVAGVEPENVLACAAAVEMIHAASLVHDDVIDGGDIRRGSPAFWRQKGAQGAILVGDLLVCRAINLLCESPGASVSVPALVRMAGEMCDAEVEQELILRGSPASWNQCVGIARRKTGSLFAFAGFASGADPEMRLALEQAGYAIGTAYQLADDFYDAYGKTLHCDKTLGNDAGRQKATAASSVEAEGVEPLEYIDGLCRASAEGLGRWPAIQAAWKRFIDEEMKVAMDTFLQPFREQVDASTGCVRA